MKKFLDITGLKTLVDWIKSKFNSVEKAQYVANRSFKKYTRKKEKEIYIIGKAMKQSPIGQTCWYYNGNSNTSTPSGDCLGSFNINFVRLFLNQFTPPPHSIWDNMNLLLEGFDYNITFYFNYSKIGELNYHFKVEETEIDEHSHGLKLKQSYPIGLNLRHNYSNFGCIPSESITTGETNGRKSISFSVYLKMYYPNENDIVKSSMYKIEHRKSDWCLVKKLKDSDYYFNESAIFERGTTYSYLLESTVYNGIKFESYYIKKRGTSRKRRRLRVGPKFSKVNNLNKCIEPGYYQLWKNYRGVKTHINDFVITPKRWEKGKPITFKILNQ